MAFPNFGAPQLPLKHSNVNTPGADFANPKAEAINKKRKKYQANPSMAGLKTAASNAPKPFMSEGKPGAGVGGNL